MKKQRKYRKAQIGLDNGASFLKPKKEDQNLNWLTNNSDEVPAMMGKIDPLSQYMPSTEGDVASQRNIIPITRTDSRGGVGFSKSVGTGVYEDNPYVKSFNVLASGITGIGNTIQNNKLKNEERMNFLRSIEPPYWENADAQGLGGPPAYTKYGGGRYIAKRPYGGGPLTSVGAKEILRDGTVHGRKLTLKQKKYFGWVAGGSKQAGGVSLENAKVRANKAAKDFSISRGLIIGEDAHADPSVQYIDASTGMPYIPRPVKSLPYTVPNNVQASDLHHEQGYTWYVDPITGDVKDVDSSVLNLPRFRVGAPKQAGGSIYNYLESKGIRGSLANRKKLFGKHIKNYTGTAEQNIQLLNDLESGKISIPDQKETPWSIAKQELSKKQISNPQISKAQSDTIQSGWVVDRSTGKMYPVQNSKAGKPINVITGKNPHGYYNPSGVKEENMTSEQQATVPGYYLLHKSQEGLTDFQKTMYKKMRTMEPISAKGVGKPNSSGQTFYETKSVHRGDFENMDPFSYQNYMTVHGTHGCVGSDCDKPEDFDRMDRVNPNTDTLAIFSSGTLLGKKMLQKYGIKQTGGLPSGLVNVEEGEIVQGGDGNIVKVDDNAGTHEQGGLKLGNVSRVLEDTGDKRKDKASKTLLITPEEMEALFGFKPKRSVTHSKAFELANEHYDKDRKKIKDNNKIINTRPRLDKYGSNAAKLNFKTFQDIPSEQEVHDALFMHQESVKDMNGIQDDGSMAKKGGKYKMAQAGIDNAKEIMDTRGWTHLYDKGDKSYYKKANGQVVAVPKSGTPTRLATDPNKYLKDLQKRFPNATGEDLAKNKYISPDHINEWNTKYKTISGTDYGYINMPGEEQHFDHSSPVGTTDSTVETAGEQKKPLDTSVNTNPRFIRQPANRFHEATYWDDLAPGVSSFIDSLNRDSELYNPTEFSKRRYKLYDPTAALNANQADYNAAADTLGNMNIGSGAAAANLANLQAQKYATNNQVSATYDNQNVTVKNREVDVNAEVADRQSVADAQTREGYDTRVKLSREAQRQQRLKSIEDISRTIQLKRRQNTSGNLILKLSPAFNQQGDYNGYQYGVTLPSELGYAGDTPVIGTPKTLKNKKTVTKTWIDAAGQRHKEVTTE